MPNIAHCYRMRHLFCQPLSLCDFVAALKKDVDYLLVAKSAVAINHSEIRRDCAAAVRYD